MIKGMLYYKLNNLFSFISSNLLYNANYNNLILSNNSFLHKEVSSNTVIFSL